MVVNYRNLIESAVEKNPPSVRDLKKLPGIKSDGTWYYMDSPIGRKRLVNLFARILRKEKDGT